MCYFENKTENKQINEQIQHLFKRKLIYKFFNRNIRDTNLYFIY